MKAFEIKTSLFPHQMRAVEKLTPTRVGALFMEMGTGKSRTAIELVALRQDRVDKVVWFCPVGLKTTIAYEIEKHTGEEACVFTEKTTEENIPKKDWYVIGIESMSISRRVAFAANKLISDKTFVIVDESSFIKGYSSIRTKIITKISERCKYRLLLTGTPISNGIVDLYAQMCFLSPKILGYSSFYKFSANHLVYSEKYPGMIVRSLNTDYVAAKIAPYVYKVTKDECLSLPDKIYDDRYVSLSDDQWQAYEDAKFRILESCEIIDSYTIFKLFNTLQQIACGFIRIKKNRKEIPNSRIDTLKSVINEIPVNEKIIIWAKYVYDIKRIAEHLTNAGESFSLIYGELSSFKRQSEIDAFRADNRFLVATQGCGGFGLTLNEASYVIFYSSCFKWSSRKQAEDRCHRIGQKKRVSYITLIANCGIEKRIDAALANKSDAAKVLKKEIELAKDKDARAEIIKGL